VLLHIERLGDASKNVAVWARGHVGPDDQGQVVELLDLEGFAPDQRNRRPRTIQLVSALWTLQEKLGLYVWTAEERKPENLLLLMESRNFVRFDREITLENWKGKLYFEPFNVPEAKWFWFQLEFDKVF
jgi:hypothetical protein